MRERHQLLCLAPVALVACGQAAPGSSLATCRTDPVNPAAAGCGLVVNEVAAAGAPDDWFEVINTGVAPIDLSDFVYVDTAGALDRARAFPAYVLRPGERHVQYVSAPIAGFQLGSDEALFIYRADNGAVVDHADWSEGASPAGGSFARFPDGSGAFAPAVRDTQGGPNGPNAPNG